MMSVTGGGVGVGGAAVAVGAAGCISTAVDVGGGGGGVGVGSGVGVGGGGTGVGVGRTWMGVKVTWGVGVAPGAVRTPAVHPARANREATQRQANVRFMRALAPLCACCQRTDIGPRGPRDTDCLREVWRIFRVPISIISPVWGKVKPASWGALQIGLLLACWVWRARSAGTASASMASRVNGCDRQPQRVNGGDLTYALSCAMLRTISCVSPRHLVSRAG